MSRKSFVSVLVAATLSFSGSLPGSQIELKSEKERASYAAGFDTIRTLKKHNIPLDLDSLIRGLRDAAADRKPALNDGELNAVLSHLQADMRRGKAAQHRELAAKNRNRGNAFLAEFKRQEGVKSLPNGVLYQVLKAGNGKRPAESDSVEVLYRGTTLDGKQFDATPPGKTTIMSMNQAIVGWRDALKQMPVGSRWKIVIPYLIAYGERGVGDVIGPNETLVFEVELVSIQ
ncbi:FKBP-type peptidyl-prolyl cis-trans isomerase [Methyloterricola oryzae]|uniref:FKBP-type peptidyl-prolyl cis-trans isomerase n=1 Tax=Methyloterricola oryzae TaxID=1495050 RepID=UPI00069B1277|nr:FKBP-type peptidyl-prolyl cis-trans isomerase [Methyloterricola oryzae]